MADFIHLSNIIQGEVIRIRERRPLEDQPVLLRELIDYLKGETLAVTETRQSVLRDIEGD
jgi:hypothetical protein